MKRTIIVDVEAVDVTACRLNISVERLTRCFEFPSDICLDSSRPGLDTRIATHLQVPISLSADPATELLLDFQA
jgi:hypothetical protein